MARKGRQRKERNKNMIYRRKIPVSIGDSLCINHTVEAGIIRPVYKEEI